MFFDGHMHFFCFVLIDFIFIVVLVSQQNKAEGMEISHIPSAHTYAQSSNYQHLLQMMNLH